MSPFRITSFSRSFLACHSCDRGFRRAWRVLRAARRRWPDGRLSVSWAGVRWVVGGCAGVCVWWSSSWPESRRFLWWERSRG